MIFRFYKDKIQALSDSGFKGKPVVWFKLWADSLCPCCEWDKMHHRGMVYDPPDNVTKADHNRAIKLALKKAGF